MKILIPVDGSHCANKTLLWAAQTFDKKTAEYYLIFIIPIVVDMNMAESDMANASMMLQRSKSMLEEQGCKVTEAEFLLGFAGDRICGYAETGNMDLVVIGSHGRSGIPKILLGSTSEEVLEHCKRPVVVYKNIERQAEPKHTEHNALSHTIL